MRYYVVARSELDGVTPHIIAEVVRDRAESDKIETLASTLCGEGRVIATRTELLDHPAGVAALEAWESHDDSAYDSEREALRARDDRPRRGLRLVKTAEVD